MKINRWLDQAKDQLMKMNFKALSSKRIRSLSRLSIFSLLTLLLVFFQNCGPVGDPGGDKGESASNVFIGGGDNSSSVGGNTQPAPGGTNNLPGGNGTTTPPDSGGETTPPPIITNNLPPPNPTGLTLSANGTNNISLRWNSGLGSTVGFRLAYKEGTAAPSDCSDSTALTVSNTTGSVAGLTRARQYSFRVCALNGNTTPDISSGITLTTGTRCFQNVAPTIQDSSYAPFSFPMGMGPLSGSATNIANVPVTGSNSGGPYDANQTYSLRCSTTPQNIVDLNCDGNNGTNFTGNTVQVTFRQDNNVECPPSGPVTVKMRARDECGAESEEKTITVNVLNACLPEQKVVAEDRQQNDQLGSQVAIDGDYAVAIETGDNGGGQDSGAANVYFYNGTSWVFQQKLIPTESAAYDNMTSVSISGNRIAIGSPYHANVGKVFIFERSGSTWNQTASISPSQPNVQDVGDRFGMAVSLKGTQLAVGAPWDNNVELAGSKLAYAGAVYVYNLSNSSWVQDGNKLVVAGNTGRNSLGYSLAIGSGFIVAGAPHDETFKSNGTGKVYVLTKSGSDWAVSQTLESSNKKAGDMFGVSVATDGTRIAVGALFATGKSGQTQSGAAYVFENSGGWTEKALIGASDTLSNDHFGASLAIEGDDLIVGAPWTESKTGSIFQFKRNGFRPGWVIGIVFDPCLNGELI